MDCIGCSSWSGGAGWSGEWSCSRRSASTGNATGCRSGRWRASMTCTAARCGTSGSDARAPTPSPPCCTLRDARLVFGRLGLAILRGEPHESSSSTMTNPERLEDVCCDICGSSARSVLYKYVLDPNHANIVVCDECGFTYLCPRPKLSHLSEFYGDNYYIPSPSTTAKISTSKTHCGGR